MLSVLKIRSFQAQISAYLLAALYPTSFPKNIFSPSKNFPVERYRFLSCTWNVIEGNTRTLRVSLNFEKLAKQVLTKPLKKLHPLGFQTKTINSFSFLLWVFCPQKSIEVNFYQFYALHRSLDGPNMPEKDFSFTFYSIQAQRLLELPAEFQRTTSQRTGFYVWVFFFVVVCSFWFLLLKQVSQKSDAFHWFQN